MLLVWRRAAGDFGILLNLDVNKIPSRLCVSVYPEIDPAIALLRTCGELEPFECESKYRNRRIFLDSPEPQGTLSLYKKKSRAHEKGNT